MQRFSGFSGWILFYNYVELLLLCSIILEITFVYYSTILVTVIAGLVVELNVLANVLV